MLRMLQHVLIGDNERILVIRKRRFVEILGPGERPEPSRATSR
jgi:hypothetical protein